MPPTRYGCALAAAAALAGCQSYRPEPLDLQAHHAQWGSRSASDESVAEFARRLAAEQGATDDFDLADGLSLSEAEVVALVFNPDLRMARLRAGLALAGARHAGLWEDPQFGLDLERIIESVPEPWSIAASIGITLPLSGRLAVEEARAEADHRAALRRIAADEWSVRLALRKSWLTWSAQRQRAELLRQLLDQFESLLAVVSQLEAAGELSRSEARLLRIDQAMRDVELRSAEAAAHELELELKALMGLAPAAPAPLVPAPIAAPSEAPYEAPYEAPDSPGDQLAALQRSNPTLAVLQADYETAEQALRLEIRRQYPDITIGPGLGIEDGEERVLLGLSFPIPLWNRNQRAIAEATAARELARGAVETELERLGARLAVAESQRSAARQQRIALESHIVPLVEDQNDETRRIAELGEVDTLLLLENLTRLHETKLALIEAHLAEALAAARVIELVGPAAPPFPPLAPHQPEPQPAPQPSEGGAP